MNNLKVISINADEIIFSDGTKLYSEHYQDCCENHYLCFEELSISDFEGLYFDLSNENFFKKIDGYGIELIPIYGHSIKIAGYGYNNGYYSTDLSICVKNSLYFKKYDITECQIIKF